MVQAECGELQAASSRRACSKLGESQQQASCRERESPGGFGAQPKTLGAKLAALEPIGRATRRAGDQLITWPLRPSEWRAPSAPSGMGPDLTTGQLLGHSGRARLELQAQTGPPFGRVHRARPSHSPATNRTAAVPPEAIRFAPAGFVWLARKPAAWAASSQPRTSTLGHQFAPVYLLDSCAYFATSAPAELWASWPA